MLVALPLGLLSAIYLSEYAPDRIRRLVKPILEVLAGIPTVVYGYFALLFVTPILRSISGDIAVFNALSASIVMGIMILPMVSSLSEDAMRSVPRTLREGAYALGGFGGRDNRPTDGAYDRFEDLKPQLESLMS
jgi:phosphate transport system permease protein